MRTQSFSIRRAEPEDAPEIAVIYNEGIDERAATFNTEHVTADDRRNHIEKGGDKHPVFVAVQNKSDKVAGWASISAYSPRSCYVGIGEVSVYVRKEYRGRGLGKALLLALITEARLQAYWKLMGRIFAFNQVSRGIFRDLGFREIGVHEKHAKLDGKWIDVVEVELPIPENIV